MEDVFCLSTLALLAICFRLVRAVFVASRRVDTTLTSMMIRRCTTRRTHLAHLRLSKEILRRQFVKWRQQVLYQAVSRIYEFDEP